MREGPDEGEGYGAEADHEGETEVKSGKRGKEHAKREEGEAFDEAEVGDGWVEGKREEGGEEWREEYVSDAEGVENGGKVLQVVSQLVVVMVPERGGYLFVEVIEEVEWDEAEGVDNDHEGQWEEHRSLDSLDRLRRRPRPALERCRPDLALLGCWWYRFLFRPPSFDP